MTARWQTTAAGERRMNEKARTLAFIGLGVMGGCMCANLIRKQDAPVIVHDRNGDAVAAQVALGMGSAIAAALAEHLKADREQVARGCVGVVQMLMEKGFFEICPA